jgi:prepilin-type N-terminal cleavage/methylation domain-containing protein
MKAPEAARGQGGFSIVELLIVVAVIAIMAAVALPNLAGYLRNYRIRGASQQVAGEIQNARMKAITQNVNRGITFAVVDADSYRWVSDDAEARGDDPYLGTLLDLPTNVRFDQAAGGATSIRFNRLGSACAPGTGACGTAFPVNFYASGESGRATLSPAPANTYIGLAPAGGWIITVREQTTQLTRQIRISPGGRVSPQQ